MSVNYNERIPNNVLADKLAEAIKAKGGEPAKGLLPRRWRLERGINWQSEYFGICRIDVGGCELGTPVTEGPSTWVELKTHNQPKRVTVFFEVDLQPGVRVFRSVADQPVDVTNEIIERLEVKVNWKERHNDRTLMPQTRKRDADNLDLILANEQGMAIQLQVAVVTRNGTFWLSIQEIQACQAVRTTTSVAKTLGRTTLELKRDTDVVPYATFTVPAMPEYAYDGADYIKMRGPGKAIVELMHQLRMTVPLSKAVVTQWVPQELELSQEFIDDGWRTGVVTWYNIVYGGGFAICDDGKPCFIHFSSVVDMEDGKSVAKSGGFPVLRPMYGIAIKWRDEKGGRKAIAVMRTPIEVEE